MIVIGIDPGFTGAIAILEVGKYRHIIRELYDMPIIKVGKKTHLDGYNIKSLLNSYNKESIHVFIEKAQVMPKQGIVGAGAYMKGAGILEGICIGIGFPLTLITPQSWKKSQMAGMPKEKGASIVRAKQLFPHIDLPRKKDHGLADAVLIALHGLSLQKKCSPSCESKGSHKEHNLKDKPTMKNKKPCNKGIKTETIPLSAFKKRNWEEH